MRSVASLTLAAVLAAASPAAAGGPPGTVEPEPQPPATQVERYGLHVLLADVSWFAGSMVVAGLDHSGGDGAAYLALGGYVGGGPIVHLAHGNNWGALKSLGTRVVLPFAGGFVGMAIAGSQSSPNDEDDGLDEFGGLMLGFSAGLLSAMVLDWTVYAKQETTVLPDVALRTGLRPGVNISRDRLGVSLGGTF